MRYNQLGSHELLKLRCFQAETKLMLFFSSLWHFLPRLHDKVHLPPPLSMSSGPLSGRQRRMMGKWVFFQHWALPSLLYVAPVFSQMIFQFERKMPTRVGSVGAARYLNRWHPEDRACERVTMETGRMTDTSRIRLLSCLLFPLPPPSSPHNLPGTHMLQFHSAGRWILPLC